MWNKQQAVADAPAAPPVQTATSPVVPFNAPSGTRLGNASVRETARLGASLAIKGHITGTEDLRIDGKVDGPVSLRGHELTIGPTAQLNSEIQAGEVVVYGKVVGNLHARGRVDIKKDGSIVGDISSARISIEDGAHFKGRIEIDPTKTQAAAD
ncbi:MAG: cell shape determination protein CcmA [Acidobacteria bacterium]|nr:MAG: cell shape determination protein CcmA [Acidobacteriota bacterium]